MFYVIELSALRYAQQLPGEAMQAFKTLLMHLWEHTTQLNLLDVSMTYPSVYLLIQDL